MVLVGNELCIGGQNESDCSNFGYSSNLYHDASVRESLCSLISRETRTKEIFVPDEIGLPLIDVPAALDAACGDMKFLVNAVIN
jgi:hypothetical protein